MGGLRTQELSQFLHLLRHGIASHIGGWQPATMEHGHLIDLLGGPAAVAEIAGVNFNTPFKWATRGIPSHRWILMVRAANARGIPVTIEKLAASSPPKYRRHARKPKPAKRRKRRKPAERRQ